MQGRQVGGQAGCRKATGIASTSWPERGIALEAGCRDNRKGVCKGAEDSQTVLCKPRPTAQASPQRSPLQKPPRTRASTPPSSSRHRFQTGSKRYLPPIKRCLLHHQSTRIQASPQAAAERPSSQRKTPSIKTSSMHSFTVEEQKTKQSSGSEHPFASHVFTFKEVSRASESAGKSDTHQPVLRTSTRP